MKMGLLLRINGKRIVRQGVFEYMSMYDVQRASKQSINLSFRFRCPSLTHTHVASDSCPVLGGTLVLGSSRFLGLATSSTVGSEGHCTVCLSLRIITAWLCFSARSQRDE
jgi:hypothetical protein